MQRRGREAGEGGGGEASAAVMVAASYKFSSEIIPVGNFTLWTTSS